MLCKVLRANAVGLGTTESSLIIAIIAAARICSLGTHNLNFADSPPGKFGEVLTVTVDIYIYIYIYSILFYASLKRFLATFKKSRHHHAVPLSLHAVYSVSVYDNLFHPVSQSWPKGVQTLSPSFTELIKKSTNSFT